MDIRTVGVVGAGLMGSGIVETAARSGYDVVVREVDEGPLDAGRKRIEASTEKAVERGKMSTDDRTTALHRIRYTTNLDDLAGCDIVIEAVVEDLELKKDIFKTLDAVTRPDVILASNTSSVSITSLAAVTSRPERVAGCHFFNPVPVMQLVELVRGLLTSDETIETLREFGASLGKTVVVAQDTPGFLVNYLLIPYILDAVRMVENEVATIEDIDTAIKLGLNHPMGPLTLMDYVGIDTTLYIADVMYDAFKDPKYAASPLLRKLVEAGFNGSRKPGRGGIYDYVNSR